MPSCKGKCFTSYTSDFTWEHLADFQHRIIFPIGKIKAYSKGWSNNYICNDHSPSLNVHEIVTAVPVISSSSSKENLIHWDTVTPSTMFNSYSCPESLIAQHSKKRCNTSSYKYVLQCQTALPKKHNGRPWSCKAPHAVTLLFHRFGIAFLKSMLLSITGRAFCRNRGLLYLFYWWKIRSAHSYIASSKQHWITYKLLKLD